MIDKVLKFLQDEINSYLNIKFNETNKSTKSIVLTNIVGQNGQTEIPDSSLGLTLVNIEEEKVLKTQNFYKTDASGNTKVVNPPLKLNLFILIAANFKPANYDEGLKKLSYVIHFFQSRNAFDHKNFPNLDEALEKLTIDLYSIPFEQQNQLWASLGAKYMPSVLYKVKTVLVEDDRFSLSAPVTTINAELTAI